MDDDIDAVLEHFLRMLGERISPPLPESFADNPKFVELHTQLQTLREIAANFAMGDISYPIKTRGFIAGGMKNLQANLRHLTWQVRQVEKKDFSQRVSFMGEFSEAFNSMVAQLAATMAELESSEARFKDMANYDALTRAYSRSYFMADVKRLLREANDSGEPFSLVMADLDKFKTLNDTFGHQCGDAALQHVVRLLQGALRKNDRVYRYGGEEFAVLLAGTTLPRATEIAERMRSNMESTPVQWEEKEIAITSSFGICSVEPESGRTYEIGQVVEIADKNLYLAKKHGRNRVVSSIFDHETA